MRGFPHSNEPEKAMKEELWVGVTPSGQSPMKPRVENLVSNNTKLYETQTPLLGLYIKPASRGVPQ